jgi:5-methylcytosine-specific restriction endonuclease McrA
MAVRTGECVLMPKDVPPKKCHWCLGDLTGRQTRWCSQACSSMFWKLHDWNSARAAAIKRDGGICQSCGIQTVPLSDARWTLHPEAPQHPQFDRERSKTEGDDYRREHWTAIRLYDVEFKKFLRRVAYPVSPEVNHKEPRVGQGYGFGCWNHPENLETLCHRCHVRVTSQQKRERKLGFAEAYVASEQMAMEDG